jgi:hypothetical protein
VTPRRIRQDEIRLNFVDDWRAEAIEASTIEITIDPGNDRAWLACRVPALLAHGCRCHVRDSVMIYNGASEATASGVTHLGERRPAQGEDLAREDVAGPP